MAYIDNNLNNSYLSFFNTDEAKTPIISYLFFTFLPMFIETSIAQFWLWARQGYMGMKKTNYTPSVVTDHIS
jgi:hypothetical protein